MKGRELAIHLLRCLQTTKAGLLIHSQHRHPLSSSWLSCPSHLGVSNNYLLGDVTQQRQLQHLHARQPEAATATSTRQLQHQPHGRHPAPVDKAAAWNPEPVRLALPPQQLQLQGEEDRTSLHDATELIRRLHSVGHLAFIAGGWVRDRFIGQASPDIDIATSASVPELQKLLGPSHVAQLHPNTARVRQGLNQFEVSTFKGNKRQANEMSAHRDACNRDFTINSLLYDPVSDEVLDYVGAVQDIENKVLRMNCYGAFHRVWTVMMDDPVRVLRGVRFCIKFNLDLDPDTLNHMRFCMSLCILQGPMHLQLRYIQKQVDSSGPALHRISEARPARVWRELQKISALEASCPGAFAQALRLCQRVGLLTLLFPFLGNSALASQAWQVHGSMPRNLPLELRILGLVNPFSLPSIFHDATEMLRKMSKEGSRSGDRPDMELVQLYNTCVKAVEGLYKVPQTLHKGTWVAILAHKHSQECIEVLAAWIHDMDLQQHAVGTQPQPEHEHEQAGTEQRRQQQQQQLRQQVSAAGSPGDRIDQADAWDTSSSSSSSSSSAVGQSRPAASGPGGEELAASSFKLQFLRQMDELRLRWASDIQQAA